MERKRNPLVRSLGGGRILSASQLPWFTVLPPHGFGVLTTTGRRTGRRRRKCVRAIRRGSRAYLVSIGGGRAAWMKNVWSDPHVELRIREGWFTGIAREPSDAATLEEARRAYCGTVNPFDYVECLMHRPGRPTRAKVRELHASWFENGRPLVIELGAG